MISCYNNFVRYCNNYAIEIAKTTVANYNHIPSPPIAPLDSSAFKVNEVVLTQGIDLLGNIRSCYTTGIYTALSKINDTEVIWHTSEKVINSLSPSITPENLIQDLLDKVMNAAYPHLKVCDALANRLLRSADFIIEQECIRQNEEWKSELVSTGGVVFLSALLASSIGMAIWGCKHRHWKWLIPPIIIAIPTTLAWTNHQT